MSKNNFLNKVYPIFLIFISINICLNIKHSIVLPYNIFTPPVDDKSTKEEIFLSLERNYIYSLLEIGNPPKKIPILFNFNDSFLSFRSDLNFLSILESSYTPSGSESFQDLENGKAKEELYFDKGIDKFIKNFTFLYQNLNKKSLNYYGCIGLQNFYLENNRKNILNPNFLYQLKKLELIDYISFSINQTSDTKGFINFNLEPNEYAPNLYSIKNKYITFVKGVESNIINKAVGKYLWNLDISLVYYRNHLKKQITINVDHYEMNEDQYSAILNPAYGLIKGPYSFRNLIKTDFFDEFMKNNVCTISKVNKLYFYSCNANYKEKLKQRFPAIYFYLLELNYRFVLDFDDLFYEKNGLLFFLICYDSGVFGDDKFSQISEWVLGKPFFKKYQFSFDVEKKIISFYENKKGYPHEQEKNTKDDINKKNIIKQLEKNKYLYVNRLLPIKNLIFISLSLFVIFVAFFCIFYNLRVSHIKFEKEKKMDEKGKNYVELKENLDSFGTENK